MLYPPPEHVILYFNNNNLKKIGNFLLNNCIIICLNILRLEWKIRSLEQYSMQNKTEGRFYANTKRKHF